MQQLSGETAFARPARICHCRNGEESLASSLSGLQVAVVDTLTATVATAVSVLVRVAYQAALFLRSIQPQREVN